MGLIRQVKMGKFVQYVFVDIGDIRYMRFYSCADYLTFNLSPNFVANTSIQVIEARRSLRLQQAQKAAADLGITKRPAAQAEIKHALTTERRRKPNPFRTETTLSMDSWYTIVKIPEGKPIFLAFGGGDLMPFRPADEWRKNP